MKYLKTNRASRVIFNAGDQVKAARFCAYLKHVQKIEYAAYGENHTLWDVFPQGMLCFPFTVAQMQEMLALIGITCRCISERTIDAKDQERVSACRDVGITLEPTADQYVYHFDAPD